MTDLDAVALPTPAVAQVATALASGFDGEIVVAGNPDYDTTRSVWNAMVDKRPGLIAICTSTSDVVAVVDAARAAGIDPAVRGGGHSVAGNSISEGGVTIDLRGLRDVTVDPERKLVRAGGGCLLGDIDEATAPHGLVVPAGVMSRTGVGGLALGGGFGWLSRKYGLTCDNVESFDVVLANGDVVVASADEHPDLFWALRGGGGNFGVVTRFTFRAHEFAPMLRVGMAVYRQEDAAQALREYGRAVGELPRNVGWQVILKSASRAGGFVPAELDGLPLMIMVSMWLDDPRDPAGVECTDRLRSIGTPSHSVSAVLPFAQGVQKMTDADFEDGHRNYTKEIHLAELSDEVIDHVLSFWADMPMAGGIAIHHLGGAIKDIPEEATAFANRGHDLWLNFSMRWDEIGRAHV